MGKHEEISEAARAEVGDDWVVTRCISRTAQKFGLTNQVVKQIIYDAAVFASLPENIKADIASEVRRLQMMMDRYWPDAMVGDKKAAELRCKLGVDLRLLGSAKLEELLNRISALPPPTQSGDCTTGSQPSLASTAHESSPARSPVSPPPRPFGPSRDCG